MSPARGRARRVLPLLGVSLALLSGADALAGSRGPELPTLPQERVHPSGAFSFRTPVSWRVGVPADHAGAYQAEGDGVIVRFLFEPGEIGFDGLHATCMLERLSGAMDSDPQVQYDYDFVTGQAGDRRILDSAFVVTYDAPVLGHKSWRQRNLTLVGAGESLCVITYVPTELWKKSKPVRALLDAIVASLAFR